MHLVLVLGNQLFEPSEYTKNLGEKERPTIFMREDAELCTYYRFHKHKIIFFLSAMRSFAKEMEAKKFPVHYEKLETSKSKGFEDALSAYIKKNKVKKVSHFEIEDKFFEKRIAALLKSLNVDVDIWPSPMFLTLREEFQHYLGKSKKPFMKVFYQQQRIRLQVLITKANEPIGGKWSFDEENRLPLPAKSLPPDVPRVKPSATTQAVQALTDKEFPDHPGKSEQFWLPVDRPAARAWLENFLEERLAQFGPYEDAIPVHTDFVYHSILTPFLNCGLLLPSEIVEATLTYSKKNKVPMASVEGFLRQIIGWREFIRGIYQNFSTKQETTNFFKHSKKLTAHWYRGDTGIAPLDNTIRKLNQFAYAHHIERLMVVGSLMLLLEIDPKEAHRWFMEMFIDSSDWVMGPNVYGMALFADGGIFATKPYFCGSNYYRKMGGYKASESWCAGVDGLYWGFVDRHRTLFLKNPRTSMMVRTFDKMDTEKKKDIFAAANQLRKKLTV